MFVRVVFFLAFVIYVNADSFSDFLDRLNQCGVKFPKSGMQKIVNCTEPTVFKNGDATAAANQFKTCALNHCLLGGYSDCSPILQAISTNDQCLKPQVPSQTTMKLIDKLMPYFVPQIKNVYGNLTATVMKAKAAGGTEYNIMLSGYTYGLKVVTKGFLDTVCQGLLPYMTKLEQQCALKNLKAIVDVTGYVCATKMA